MGDARGRGFNRGRGKWHHRLAAINLVRPTEYGWVVDGKSEIDGCTIFRLDDIAIMKADINTPGQWIGNVLVNGRWQGFQISGMSLSDITEQIRKMTCPGCDEAIPWQGEPMGNEPVTQFEDYGLMGTR